MRPRLELKRPSGCLLNGLRLAIRNWPCLLSGWVVGATVCLLAGSPLTSKIAPAIAPTMTAAAAARMTTTVSVSLHFSQFSGQVARTLSTTSLKGLSHLLGPPSRKAANSTRARTALGLAVLGLALLLFIASGTLPMYLGEGPPRFRVLLKCGGRYFWRFVRALIFAAMVSIPVLAGLVALCAFLLHHMSKFYAGHTVFLYSSVTGAILFSALLLLLWADLVEVYAVRSGTLGNSRVRQALLPALTLLGRQSLWILPSFLIAGALGVTSLLAFLFLSKALLLSNHLWLAYAAAQTGVFLLLAARYWQRGAEAAIVMAAELNHFQRATPPPDPTLQDLVLKLKEQPWAKPDSAPLNPTLFPEAARLAMSPPPERASQEALLAAHAKKFTLLDALTEEAAPASPSVPFLR